MFWYCNNWNHRGSGLQDLSGEFKYDWAHLRRVRSNGCVLVWQRKRYFADHEKKNNNKAAMSIRRLKGRTRNYIKIVLFEMPPRIWSNSICKQAYAVCHILKELSFRKTGLIWESTSTQGRVIYRVDSLTKSVCGRLKWHSPIVDTQVSTKRLVISKIENNLRNSHLLSGLNFPHL